MPSPLSYEAKNFIEIHIQQSSMLIKDQLVLVTSGARGFREPITRAFLSQGAKVIINYNNSIQTAYSLVEEYPEHALALQADHGLVRLPDKT